MVLDFSSLPLCSVCEFESLFSSYSFPPVCPPPSWQRQNLPTYEGGYYTLARVIEVTVCDEEVGLANHESPTALAHKTSLSRSFPPRRRDAEWQEYLYSVLNFCWEVYVEAPWRFVPSSSKSESFAFVFCSDTCTQCEVDSASSEEARICNLFKLRAARLCFAHAWQWKQDVTATGARGDTLRYWTRSDLWPAKWKHGSDLVMNRWNAKSYKGTTQMRSFGRLIVQAYTRSQMRIFLRPFRKVNRSARIIQFIKVSYS